MKTVLCVPPQGYLAERWHGAGLPSLGILYLASVLEQNGKDVSILDASADKLSMADAIERLETLKTDIAGITVTTENRFDAFNMARFIKRALPQSIVIVGGPHCFHTDIDTLAHILEIDIVVRGEGEETIVDLQNALENNADLRSVAGISFRRNGRIIQNPLRPAIADLNRLPKPARHLINMSNYSSRMVLSNATQAPAANIMTSRGCPFCCNFCATPGNWGRKVRGLTPENVLKEVDEVVTKYGVRTVWFYDDMFNYDLERLREICRMLIERDYRIKWFADIRVDNITKEIFALMVEAGLRQVSFGIESANERICRDVVQKVATLQEAERVIAWSEEFGVIANPLFIFSHPTETKAEALETLRYAESLKGRARCLMSIMHIHPGTQLLTRAIEEKKIPEDFSWTNEHDTRVFELPEIQGHAPLYRDKLSWFDIAYLVFRLNESAGCVKVRARFLAAVRSSRSFKHLYLYSIMAIALAVVKIEHAVKWLLLLAAGGHVMRGNPTR